MTKRRRMTGGERRESILKAAQRVFSEHGFRGTTTRALADAAGVSEALVFKHFPSKAALYEAMQARLIGGETETEGDRGMASMEPSTATLVRVVHTFYARLLTDLDPDGESDQAVVARLMCRSVTEDGEFARIFLRRVSSRVVEAIDHCLPAAIAGGDLVGRPAPLQLPGWFTHHLAIMLLLNHLPRTPVLDYGVSTATLVEEAVRFALRGIGLKDEAIVRWYRPNTWRQA